MLAGLAGLTVPALAGCSGGQQTSPAVVGAVRTQPVVTPTGGLDAVIDISHLSYVTDFNLMRRHSGVLAAINIPGRSRPRPSWPRRSRAPRPCWHSISSRTTGIRPIP
jgi:hypothetical protein